VKKKALAIPACRRNMMSMKRSLLYCGVVMFALVAQSAVAQVIPPGGSLYNPPLPAPPPPPKIEVPAIPKMDELPQRSYAPITPQKSFGDRVSKCLDDAAASGLGPNERATYSRNCATR
jgi:hypothetical protein